MRRKASSELNARTDPRRDLRIAALAPPETARAAWARWRARADPWRFDPASEWWRPLLWWNLRAAGCDEDAAGLRGDYTQAWLRNEHLLSHVAPVLAACRDRGIDTMLLKGAALSRTVYEKPGLRPFGDVDVLVRPGDAAAAHGLLGKLGWAPFYHVDAESIGRHPSVGYSNRDGVDLDLHIYSLYECCAPGVDAAFWRRSVPLRVDDVETRVLAASDALMLACVHGWRYARIPTSHWMADAAVLIGRAMDSAGWDVLVDEARARRLSVQLRRALAALEPEYVSVPPDVLEALAREPASLWEHAESLAKRHGTRPWALVQAWCVEARTRLSAPDASIGFAARLQTIAGAPSGRELVRRGALAAFGRRPRGPTGARDVFGRRVEFIYDALPDARAFAAALENRLPAFETSRRSDEADRLYRLLPSPGDGGVRVLVNGAPLGTAASVEDAADLLVADLQSFLAMATPGLTFIHAGVVRFGGRTIVLPGDSGSGKSTLVAALLDAGGQYESDEFAVLDSDGRVRGFRRPLRLRRNDGPAEYRRPGRRRGMSTAPVAAGVVLCSTFKPRAVFAPQRLRASAAVLRLLNHCPGAQSRPAETMAALRALVDMTPVWTAERPDTATVVGALADARL